MLEATGRCLEVNKIKLKVPTLPGRPGGGAMGQGEEPWDRGRGHGTGGGAMGQVLKPYVCLSIGRDSRNLSICF